MKASNGAQQPRWLMSFDLEESVGLENINTQEWVQIPWQRFSVKDAMHFLS